MVKNIILVGFMGAGKTAIGKRLAKRLRYKFVDVDNEIEKLLKTSIPMIFKRHGSIRFRSEEELMLTKICQRENQVIATGGGAVVKETNRYTLKDGGIVVWLQASPEEIVKRIGAGRGRPLLKGQNISEIVERLLNERKVWYQEVADLKIDTDDKSLEEIVNEIIELLKGEVQWQK